MNFSERLKTLRLEAGYTQKEISKKIEVGQSAYVNYEKGDNKPRANRLEKLADIFGVSVSYLLGETDVRSTSEISEIMEQLSIEEQEEVIAFAQSILERKKGL